MTTQDRQLVAKHDDLEIPGFRRSEQKEDELQHAVKRDVNDGQEHDTSHEQKPKGPLFYVNRIPVSHTQTPGRLQRVEPGSAGFVMRDRDHEESGLERYAASVECSRDSPAKSEMSDEKPTARM
jgi:hypothetical protein